MNSLSCFVCLHGRHDQVGYDLGDMTLQCGRRADCVKMWFGWFRHGNQGGDKEGVARASVSVCLCVCVSVPVCECVPPGEARPQFAVCRLMRQRKH